MRSVLPAVSWTSCGMSCSVTIPCLPEAGIHPRQTLRDGRKRGVPVQSWEREQRAGRAAAKDRPHPITAVPTAVGGRRPNMKHVSPARGWCSVKTAARTITTRSTTAAGSVGNGISTAAAERGPVHTAFRPGNRRPRPCAYPRGSCLWDLPRAVEPVIRCASRVHT